MVPNASLSPRFPMTNRRTACVNFQIASLFVAIVLLPTDRSQAQIVSGLGSGGVQVNLPGLGVNVDPSGAVAVRGPRGGRRFFGRRRAATPPNNSQAPTQGNQSSGATEPTLAVPATPQPTAATPGVPTLAEGSPPTATIDPALPSPEELSKMDLPTLQAMLNETSRILNNRLALLTTGDGWQKHLQLPNDVSDTPQARLEALRKTLARYDAVSGNPAYAKIAGLPSFIATGSTLRQLIARFETPGAFSSQATDKVETNAAGVSTKPASEGELVLPTPGSPTPAATRAEHSILKRASR